MSSTNVVRNEVSVDEQAFEQADETVVDEDGFEVVEETADFQATVEMEIQAKVDSNHPDARVEEGPDHLVGKTLVQEERIQAREAELERISVQAEFGMQEDRERRTREIAAEGSRERRRAFEKRRASVDRFADPDRVDPRVEIGRQRLAEVNKQTERIHDKLDGWSRGAISNHLAEELVRGKDMTSAVVDTFDALQTAEGTVIPISEVANVNRPGVSIEGEITQLWDPTNAKTQQVGLIEDDTGRTKFTVWKKSNQPLVDLGETVQIRNASKSWYQGRVSVTLTSWSDIHFHDRTYDWL